MSIVIFAWPRKESQKTLLSHILKKRKYALKKQTKQQQQQYQQQQQQQQPKFMDKATIVHYLE